MRSINPAAIGFLPEFLDFKRGIRVGNLEPRERITRILKTALEERHGEDFVTDRWGRGVYWQWICFVSRSNRAAKPYSSRVNFGCAKFFISLDRDEGLFKSGLQVERGFLKAPRDYRQCELKKDWDWNRLVSGLTSGGKLEKELKRLLLRDGFRLQVGEWGDPLTYDRKSFPKMSALRRALRQTPPRDWAGIQLYYPMEEKDVRASTGLDLVESMLAVFEDLTPVMNLCMQTSLTLH